MEQHKLIHDGGLDNDNFGSSVDADGETIIVGAQSDDNGAGAGYIFIKNSDSWIQHQKLSANDAEEDDNFGISVAIDGATLVIGADYADGANPDSGAAYVFQREASSWVFQDKLIANDGKTGDNFGASVDISGTTIVIGARTSDTAEDSDAGSAYVFTKNGGIWTQQDKLLSDDPFTSDKFGESVAIFGDIVVVGVSEDDDNGQIGSGSVYVFKRNGIVWQQDQKLTASDPRSSTYFGSSVSISNDGSTFIVGAPGFRNGSQRVGVAYVYVDNNGTWEEEQKLVIDEIEPDDLFIRFGKAVTVIDDVAIIGAYQQDHESLTDCGSAYVFTRSDNYWTLEARLLAEERDASDEFGNAVAVSNDGDNYYAAIGSWNSNLDYLYDVGIVYIYELPMLNSSF